MGMQDSVGMALGDDLPVVGLDDSLLQAIKKLAAGGATALVVMSSDEVIGIVTEMDLMHSINRGDDSTSIKMAQVMTPCELITNKAVKSPCGAAQAKAFCTSRQGSSPRRASVFSPSTRSSTRSSPM